MKSTKLLKGWRMQGRCGMAAAFVCIPALPASPTAGWEAPPGTARWLWSTAELLPGISHPSLETGVCSGQKARQTLFPHLGGDGASSLVFLLNVEIFAQVTELKLDHVSWYTAPCLLELQLHRYGSKSKGGRVGAHVQRNAAYWSSAPPVR